MAWVLGMARSLPSGELSEELSRQDLTVSLRLVVLAALCHDLGGGDLRDQASAVLGLLRPRIDRADESDVYIVDATTVVLAELALRQMQGASHDLLSECICTIGEVAGSQVAAHDASSVRMVRIAAARLGLCEMPTPEHLQVDVVALTTGDEVSVRSCLAAIDRATSCGLEAVKPIPRVAHWLECVAINALHDYRLEFAADVARRAIYVGGGDGICADQATAFLTAHQTPTGEFGFYDEAIETIARHDPGLYGTARVLLPSTISCLWYLAERHLRDYRLIRDLGRGVA